MTFFPAELITCETRGNGFPSSAYMAALHLCSPEMLHIYICQLPLQKALGCLKT